ncbi:MAG: putative ABC transporter permease [Lachnospiraceae bacterium]|nr:putative ABC transporter permease [Lachnospiraceae bacterium]
MWVSRYVCLFFLYSVLGWIYESTFCTVTTKKWENRGFLFGPVCPIYGCGAVSISLIASAIPADAADPVALVVFRIFLIAWLGSMVLEYATSWTLEKLFHAVWWDYSNLPFNLHGRISLFTSLGFGVAGPLVVCFIAPPFEHLADMIPPLLMELLSLFAVALAAADAALTVAALTDFEHRVAQAESSFNDRMDMLVEDVQNSMNRAHQVALRRVKNFRYPKLSGVRLAQIREAIAKHI